VLRGAELLGEHCLRDGRKNALEAV